MHDRDVILAEHTLENILKQTLGNIFYVLWAQARDKLEF